MKTVVRLSALVTAAALAISACGGGQSPSESDAPSASTAPVAVDAVDVNEQPLDKLKDGGSLKMAIQQWITQYNSGQVDGTQGDAQAITSVVEPDLFGYDAKGVAHANPDFLVSAEVTSTSPQVVTYRLNPKARWSDGKALSAKDFQAQWKALNGKDKDYLIASSAGYELISDVTQGADATEVKVTFAAPFADWQVLFDPLFPAAAYDTPEKFNKGWRENVPITGSSWKIGSYDKTAQTITVVRDPNWWGTPPKLDSIVFRALDPAAALDAYLNKEIDYTSAIRTEAYTRLKDDPDTDIRVGARWDEVIVVLNGGRGPLADVRVRNAVEKAIDRQAIATISLKDLPVTPKPVDNHLFMPNQEGYEDTAGEYGRLDVEGAKKLLTDAGWAEGNPRTKDGQPLKLSFVLSADATQQQVDQGTLLQQMLGQVGIQLTIDKVPGNDYFEKYVNRSNFDLVSFRNVDQIFLSQAYSQYQAPDGDNVFQNYGRVSSPELVDLLKKAQVTTDRAEAIKLYNQADRLVWSLGHSIALYQRPQILAVRKGLANWGASGLSSDDYNKVGWLK
ncbi:ABC transporter family substrate-binding protein [Streptosporangium sp. CA-135522]|uniref:ABC transporter family substrate-binding protein n=1 Tax=Streptosporangium sp. CA-135522 TaxID=3240072 RepID=UPI003D8CBC8C